MSGIHMAYKGAAVSSGASYGATKLLLLMNSSSNFTKDSSSYNRTVNNISGATYYNATLPANATGAGYFNGNQGLTVPGDAVFSPSGDFTIEWFFSQSGIAQSGLIWGFLNTSNTLEYMTVRYDGSTTGKITFYSNSGGNIFSAVSAPAAKSGFAHYAICRSGATTRLFENGVILATSTTAFTFNRLSTTPLGIMCDTPDGTSISNVGKGYLTNFRWTNFALYSAAFTTPTAPLTSY